MPEGSGQAPPAQKKARWAVLLRGILRWTVRLVLLLPLLVAILVLALYIPAVQSWAKDKAIAKVSDMTGAAIRLDALHLRFPLRLALDGLHVPDAYGDTLLNAGSITVDVSLSDLLAKRINLRSVHLGQVRARLLRDAEGRFNFDHIVDAFASGDTAAPDTSGAPGWGFTVGSVDLVDVNYDMDLGPEGPDMAVRLGKLHVTMDALDLDSMKFHLRRSHIERAHMVLRTVAGEPTPDTYPDLVNPVAGFDIRSGPMLLEDASFALVVETSGDSLWIDARHLQARPGAFDLSAQHVPFERIIATGLHYGMLVHATPGDTATKPYTWPGGDDAFRCYLRDWSTEVKELLVTDAGFAMHTDGVVGPQAISDPDHVVLTDALLHLRDVVARNDSVSLDLRTFHANTVDGPLDLALRMGLGPHGTKVGTMRVAFAEQSMRMKADASWPGMRTVIERPETMTFHVEVAGRIATDPLVSMLSLMDVSVKGLSGMRASYAVDAKASGGLLELDQVQVDVHGSDGTELHLKGSVDSPMEVDRMAYDLHLHRFVMGAGVHRLASAWVQQGTILPRRVALDLDAKGSMHALETRVDLRTDLGDARGIADVWGLNGGMPDGFRVDLHAADLRLVNLLGDSTWGSMGLRVQGAGHGLRSGDRSAWLDVEPDSFIYEGKDFSALCVSAGLDRDSVMASVDLSSKPLGFMLNGRAVLPQADDSLKASVDLSLDHVHLKELGVTDHVLRSSGDWHFDAARATDGTLRVSGMMDSTRIWNLEKR
ncbi:MAG TPA: AsmA family protein, partial [Flavobacteriales bacterium]|nr:AsmA family protein [Flavobacteriales bacterium]